MPDIENQLREELKHTAHQVRPEVLRPLHVPAPRRGWRPRLVPLAAAAAMIVVIAVIALVTGLPAGRPHATPGSAPVSLPRFYLTLATGTSRHGAQESEAVIRDSVSGRVTGTVVVPSTAQGGALFVTAAADDRSFIICATAGDRLSADAGGGWDIHLFRLDISAEGKPGHPTELAAAPVGDEGPLGMALSPNGKLLAISLVHQTLPDYIGTLQVINLATGATRTWTAPATRGTEYVPGPPSWVDGNRMVAFTWQRMTVGQIFTVEGMRLLDTAAPGDNLEAATSIVPSGVAGGGAIESMLITPGGQDVIAITRRVTDVQGNTGTVVVQVVELQAGTGRLVRVLSTRSEHVNQGPYIALYGTLGVLSLGPDGGYALIQDIQFGWLDVGDPHPGQFVPLPVSGGPYVDTAAW